MNDLNVFIEQLRKEIQENDNWMTLADVTNYTSLSKSTILRRIQDGLIKVSKVNGKLLFKRSWIDNFLLGGDDK